MLKIISYFVFLTNLYRYDKSWEIFYSVFTIVNGFNSFVTVITSNNDNNPNVPVYIDRKKLKIVINSIIIIFDIIFSIILIYI